MANERLYQFPSKPTPVPADIVYVGDSANAFNEVNCTIAQIIAAYPNLSGIAGLTLSANTYAYVNGSSIFSVGTITPLSVTSLATFGFTSTATAAATTTLTATSNQQQFFTGSTTQTVVLPVTSTLSLGQSYYIVNNSSGNVTVQSSGGNTVQVMGAGTNMLITVILTSGTSAASWNVDYNFNQLISLPVSIVNGGTGVTSVTIAPAASAWAGWDANKNLSANNFLEGYATTATAAATTTLTVGSVYSQFFTGSTTQTVVMPVTSTLVLGQQWNIVNYSTGTVTIQSSGGNTILALPASSETVVTCILTSGTTAASWSTSPAISGSGTVSSGTAGQLAIYNVSGNVVSGLSGISAAYVAANSGAGIPVQMVSTTFATATLYANSTYTNTGVTATITPTASTSKIRVQALMNVDVATADFAFFQISRGGTPVGNGTAAGSRTVCHTSCISSGTVATQPIYFDFTDSPATTSPTTYTIQALTSSGGNIAVNFTLTDTNTTAFPRNISTMTLTEIK